MKSISCPAKFCAIQTIPTVPLISKLYFLPFNIISIFHFFFYVTPQWVRGDVTDYSSRVAAEAAAAETVGIPCPTNSAV